MNYLKSKTLLEAIIDKFPKKQLAFAFAYGSGVFSQSLEKAPFQNKVIDFIFAVDNPLEFHKENLKSNFSHYSCVKWAGPTFIKSLQEDYGAKIFFNSLIKVEGSIIKYGVINTNHLISDLLDWETLYCSGRLHKPVKILTTNENSKFCGALNTNLESAVHAALLCLPETFSEEELFMKIVGLSYNGDFRMVIGEDRGKIQNIVKNQMPYFQNLYYDHLKAMHHLHWKHNQGLLEQDCSGTTALHHLTLLPKRVQQNIFVLENKKNGRYRDMEDVLQALAYDTECSEIVDKAIQNIVFWPCISQSAKGVMTAGIIKSAKYCSNKLKNMVRSL